MEVQFTDFENAAFTVFIVLASRVILAFELNLYIPLSELDENMERAHRANAAVKEKFFFRRHLACPDKGVCHSLCGYVSRCCAGSVSNAAHGARCLVCSAPGMLHRWAVCRARRP